MMAVGERHPELSPNVAESQPPHVGVVFFVVDKRWNVRHVRQIHAVELVVNQNAYRVREVVVPGDESN